MSNWIRSFHRWVCIAFTVGVIVNIAFWGRKEPPAWIGALALLPLVALLLTGLYLFALPYVARARGAAARASSASTTD